MKNIILIISFLMMTALVFGKDDKLIDVKSELVRSFSKDELLIADYEANMGYPSAIYFDFNKELSIYDSMKGQIVKLNKSFDIYTKIGTHVGFDKKATSITEDSNFIYNFGSYHMEIINKNDNSLKVVALTHMRNKFNSNFGMFINNTYLNWTEDNEIYSVENPEIEMDENRKKLKGNDETVKLLQSEKFTSLGYWLDNKKRLFHNEKLITKDFSVFWYYWNDKNDSFFILGQERDPNVFRSSTLLGRDSDNNYIWNIDEIVMIFNSKGKFIKYFNIKDTYDSIYTYNDNTIYYLENKEYPMKLYKIKKQW